MPPSSRRRSTRPDTDALAALHNEQTDTPRLRKAAATDPVLDAGRREEEPDPTPPAKPARSTGSGGKEKLGFYCRPEDANRARAAYDWTRPYEQHRSLSDFIAHALMHEVERLERKYHDGQPWPEVLPGQLPTGKPIGS